MRFIRKRELAGVLGVSAQTVKVWIKTGVLPAPLQIGPRAAGWPESMIEEWIREQARKNAERRTRKSRQEEAAA